MRIGSTASRLRLLVVCGVMAGACAVSRSGDDEASPAAEIAGSRPEPDPPLAAIDANADDAQTSAEAMKVEVGSPSTAPHDTQAVATAPTEPTSPDPAAADDLGEPDPTMEAAEPPEADPEEPDDELDDLDDLDDLDEGGDEPIGPGRPTLAPELQPLPRGRWIKHRRAPRESLTQIALRYGVSESKLREWNGLGPSDPPPQRRKKLRVFARRLPPPREAVAYTVQEGDTWWSVALRHGVDGRDLRAYNWPSRKKMQAGASLEIWIDPVVHQWIAEGPDPLSPDLERRFRRGAFSVGSPNEGVLVNGLRIPDTEGVHLRIPRSAYGTSHAVEQLLLAIERFRERSDYPLEVPLGSMSRPRGGPIGGHLSHQTGRDLDIKLLRRPEIAAWREIRGSRVQWDAVWQLVLALSEVDVMVIFLDQHARRRLFRAARASGATEEQIAAGRRLVRHSPGHEHHLHVRFGCGPYEPECVP